MTLRRLLYLLPVLVFIGVGIGLALGLTRDPSVLPSALLDKSVPDFDLPPIDGSAGEGLSSRDLQAGGGPVLVNVFASWCVPCRVEHPLMMALAERGVTIYGINYKDPPEQAAAWLDELGNPFAKIGADRSGRVGIDWGVYGVPETYVVDGAGRIRHRFVGPLQPRDVDRILLPLLAELAS
jgi:cytochrome c biogenesis protein CcmG, thiol:disulfide interchange protein DsbE